MRFKEFYLKEEKYNNWETVKQQSSELRDALEVMKKINDAGFEALIVGGAVRDFVLGKVPNDLDITTNATPDQIEQIFGKTIDIGKNKAMGVTVVPYKGQNIEIATYRTDAYNDLEKGLGADKVELATSFKDDSSRRDLTINALGIDKDGNIIDHHNGLKDIENKIITTVGDPNLRFKEDWVRMLRSVRFASRLGFDIDEKTMRAIQSNSPEIQKVAKERIAKEILKMAEQPGPMFARGIEILDQSGLLKYVLPEIYGLKNMSHNPIHHPEGGSKVLGHILEALKTNKESDAVLNMSILLHDVGKLVTHGVGDTYHGHEGESRRIIEKIASDLRLENDLKDALIFAAENHMKFWKIPEMSNNKIYALMNDKNFELLKKVALADGKARGPELFDSEEWAAIENKIASLKEKFKGKSAIDEIKKVVNGNLVMQWTGLKPGKQLGDVIQQTVNWIMDNNIDINNIEQIKQYVIGISNKP